MTDEPEVNVDEAPMPLPIGEVVSDEGAVAALLKTPQDIVHTIAESVSLVGLGVKFLLCGLVCHALFGFALGWFGGWEVAAMDVVKAPLIAICSAAICYPSLYIFSAVGGSALSLKQAFALGSACVAMVGLLLVGLAPVAWLFAVSTESVPFVVILIFALWLIAVIFALKFIGRLNNEKSLRDAGGVKLWFVILIIVMLQMTTVMRPLLKVDREGWWKSGKMFFMAHFDEAMNDRSHRGK